MKTSRAYVRKAVEAVLETDAKTATVFMAPNQIIRATRRMYKRGNSRGPTEVLLTLGKPNYKERNLIKVYKATKQKFPITRVQF